MSPFKHVTPNEVKLNTSRFNTILYLKKVAPKLIEQNNNPNPYKKSENIAINYCMF